MWLMLELTDECQELVDKLIAWHSEPAQRLSSAGVMVLIGPAQDYRFENVKLRARVLDIMQTPAKKPQ